jgi:hypothetical protein
LILSPILPSCSAFAVENITMFPDDILTLTVSPLITAGALFVFDSVNMAFFEIIFEAIRFFVIFDMGFE